MSIVQVHVADAVNVQVKAYVNVNEIDTSAEHI
jgi:hypothetical protein